MRHAGAAFVVVLGVALALVPRPQRAEAAMVCELGGSGQSCAEFPIVTHWVADSGGGGFFDLAGSNADRNVSTTLRHRGHAFTVEPRT